jgi:hypothetical protein
LRKYSRFEMGVLQKVSHASSYELQLRITGKAPSSITQGEWYY